MRIRKFIVLSMLFLLVTFQTTNAMSVAIVNPIVENKEKKCSMKNIFYSIGLRKPYSVKEKAIKKITKTDFLVEEGERRQGDPPALYADLTR